MRQLLAALLLAALASPALADTNLAIICADPAAEGTTIVSRVCEAAAQRYDHPQAGDLVRFDSAATVGGAADWSRSTFVWKRWDQIAAGELHEVCTTDVAPGAPLPQAGCTGWAFAAKGGLLELFLLSWTHPTRFDNQAPLEPADIVSTTVEWSEGDTFGEVAGTRLVPGSAASVTMPNPPAGAARCYRVFTTARAPDSVERSGPPSEPWCKVMPQVEIRPMAPTKLQGN